MSLQVWLPLTKDLRQQGLDNVTVTNNGATFNSTGKLGGCYYFNGKSLYNNNFTFDSNIYSLCYWVKYDAIPNGSNWYHITLNGSTSGDYKFILGGYSSNGTTGVFRCNFSGDCGNIQLNTWYHVCATYNGTQCKIYINGELLSTFSFTTPSNSAKHLVINGRSTNDAGTTFNGVGTQCYLNDVRIYDHCLSPIEVKELAKGLVLHYPLNQSTSILTNLNDTIEYDCSGYCNNGKRIGTFTWSNDTPKYIMSTVFSGSQRIEAPWNPNGSSSFTVAGWFYNSSGTTYYGAKNTNNSYICLEQSKYFVYNSSASVYVGNYTSTRNVWQHIVLVHDIVTMKLKLYINGSFVNEVTTNGTIYNSDILDIGGRLGTAQYNGKMSDFRIYTTALSADDIKSLYQDSAYIDSSGNIYSAVYMEV